MKSHSSIKISIILCAGVLSGLAPGQAGAAVSASAATYDFAMSPPRAVQSAEASWPQFHSGPRHTGFNPYEHVLSVSNVGGMSKIWSHKIGGVVDYSSPVEAGGAVYFGAMDGNFYALNASTGRELWTQRIGPADSNRGYVDSAPAVAGGAVYVSDAGDQSEESGGPRSAGIYAFSTATGRELWKNVTATASIPSSPTVLKGVVYVGGDCCVYALSASTGRALWTHHIGLSGTSSPAIADGTVYVGSGSGKLYALKASDGRQRWSFDTGQCPDEGGPPEIIGAPAVANGVVYVASLDGCLYGVNAQTGRKIWMFSPGSGTLYGWEASPAVARGVVYIGNEDGTFYALNAFTGRKLWRYPMGEDNGVASSAAIANGVVYFGAAYGGVFALDASTGRKLWSFHGADPSQFDNSSPAVVNGKMYEASDDGHIYAFGLLPKTLSLPSGSPAHHTWGSFPNRVGYSVVSSWTSDPGNVKLDATRAFRIATSVKETSINGQAAHPR